MGRVRTGTRQYICEIMYVAKENDTGIDASGIIIHMQSLEEGVSQLQQVAIKSKVGAVSRVKNIPVKVVSLTDDKSVSRLYEHRKSPMAWFRLPFVELVCFSCDDYDEYKRNFRLQLRAMADEESRLPTDPIPIFVYVQPPRLEDSRGPLKVVDAAMKELGNKSFPGNMVVHVAKNMFGIQDLVESIRAALFVSVDSRCNAYHQEARRILSRPVDHDPASPKDTSLSELYLVKDSAAALYEAVGMHQDAWMEYSELEALIEERFLRISSSSGNNGDTVDEIAMILKAGQASSEAVQMWHRWHLHRLLVSQRSSHLDGTVQEVRAFIDLVMMPSIVSNMIRLRMKDLKRMDVLGTCLKFIDKHRLVLQEYERKGLCPASLAAAWTFAACIGSVILACSTEKALQPGTVYFSQTLEDMEAGFCDSSSREMLRIAHETLQGTDKIGQSSTFYCNAGQLLKMARDMLEELGRYYGYEPPSFYPSGKGLLDLLKNGSLKAAPKTPQAASSGSRLTPQNSIGPDDSPRFGALTGHSNELLRMAHEKTLTMDNIDLSVMEGDERSSNSGESDEKSIAARNISLHAREMSDSGNIADTVAGTIPSESYNLQVGPTRGQNINDDLSLLQAEMSINPGIGKSVDLYMDITVPGSDSEHKVSKQVWEPLYWRIQYARKGSSYFTEMWAMITSSCRDFFGKGGYNRNACILSVELGDAAYSNGDFNTAAQIYQNALENLQAQHWKHLIQSVALKLACSQIKLNDIGIIDTSNLLLQLSCNPRNKFHVELVKTFAKIFMTASSLSTSPTSSNDLVESGAFVLNPWMSLGVDKSDGLVVYEIDGMLSYSGEYEKCINGHVGDSINIPIEVINNAGVTIKLDKLSMCLVSLQEMSNIEPSSLTMDNSSPLPATPSVKNNAFQSPVFSPRSPNDEGWKPRIVSHWQDIDEVHGSCTTEGPLNVQPGKNKIEFCINPIRSGLYKLKHIQGCITGTGVKILPDFEECTYPGQRIILRVDPPAPRLFVKAIVTGNSCLISGEKQWLGIEVRVDRENVNKAQLNVDWPSNTDVSFETSPSGAVEVEHIIKPLHSNAIVKSFSSSRETIFASPVRNSDIIGSGLSSMYSLNLEDDSNLHALVWWRVHVRHTDSALEDVRIYSYSNRSRDTNATKSQAAFPSREMKRALTLMEMPISLHYSDRCSRVASSSASISIEQPFQIQTDAYEMSKGLMMVSMKITSSLARKVIVRGVSLNCQKGFILNPEHQGSSGILPCKLDTVSSLHVSFVLRLEDDLLENRAVAQAMVYRTGKLSPSIASIEYSLEEGIDDESLLESCIVDDRNIMEQSSALYSVFDRSLGPTCDDYKHVLSSMDMDESRDVYLHQHKIAFQLSSIDTDSYNVFVSIRMLGPFTASIGSPVTLCWQLERVGSGSHTGFSVISYEILADKKIWSKGSQGQGRISLGLTSGAVATIEAQWTPTSLGALEVPTLRLHDVYYQEIRETGIKKNLIIVKT